MNLQELLGSCYAVTGIVAGSVMAKAVEAAAAEKEKQVLGSITNTITTATERLKQEVQTLRDYRRLEREQADKVKKVHRAVHYFLQEGNPLPYFRSVEDCYALRVFCSKAGIDVPANDSPAYKVPDDFKSEVVEVK